jgi:hypothetical protein
MRAATLETTMSDTWYVDGDQYVVVRSGQPEQSVEIGMGSTYADALDTLETTPIQSAGPTGHAEQSALRWAHSQGWISDPDSLESDDGPELTQDWIDACPYSLAEHRTGCYYTSIDHEGHEGSCDDCAECAAELETLRDSLPNGWTCGWTGNGSGTASDVYIERSSGR